MAQLRNPFVGGNMLFANMARMNPLQQLGTGLQDVSQGMSKYDLTDAIQANSGRYDPSMNSIAMLADPTTQTAFQNLRSNEQQDNQLGISQQNADTSRFNADTSRLNYGLNNQKYGDTLKGANQLYDMFSGNNNFKKQVNQMEAGGSQNPNLMTTVGSNSTARGPYQMTKTTAKQIAEQTGKPLSWIYGTRDGQEFGMDYLTNANAKSLNGLGIPVNDLTMKAAHQMGIPAMQRLVNGSLTSKDEKLFDSNLPGWRDRFKQLFSPTVRPRQEGEQIYPSTASYYANQIGNANTATNTAMNNLLKQQMTDQSTANTAAIKQQNAGVFNQAQQLFAQAQQERDPIRRQQLQSAGVQLLTSIGEKAKEGNINPLFDPAIGQTQMQSQVQTEALQSIDKPTVSPEVKQAVKNDIASGKNLTGEDMRLIHENKYYTGDEPDAERRVKAASTLAKNLDKAGYDFRFFNGIFLSKDPEDQKAMINALANSMTKEDIAKAEDGNPQLIKDLFNKIGIDFKAKGSVGSDFEPTKKLKTAITARKIAKQLELQAMKAFPNDPEARQEYLNNLDTYQDAMKAANNSGYNGYALDFGEALMTNY